MAVDKKAAGLGVLNEFLGSLPAELQSKAREILTPETVGGAVETLGAAALRQADYFRAMNEVGNIETKRAEVQQWNDQLNQWYATNKDTLEIGIHAKKAGWKPGDPLPAGDPANPLPDDVIRKGDVDAVLAPREAGYAEFAAGLTDLAVGHLHEFGERLDTASLIRDPHVKTKGILGVYEDRVREKRQQKAAAAEETRVNARVEEKLKEERAKLHNPRFPGSPRDPGSPLDSLEGTKADPTQFSAEAAADEYVQLVASKGAAH